MSIIIFPGQGSQIKGMGEELFDQYEELTNRADNILGYSIKDLCLYDHQKQLHLTRYTQPALYVVNALSYFKYLEAGKKPDFLLGHSLGEYNALLAAGVFDFETGLRLVKKRGELMGQVVGGGMAAIIGLKKEEIQAGLDKNDLNDIDIANYNSEEQLIISGWKKTSSAPCQS